ncbi:hypothetical protein QN277_018554 [Acacia crassicarpa]|uniref:Reverse transcriptase n=1 Tax=Acacia crassicarpa TaxID=499986 RepID=A0AAE1JRV2_9FABA|nr:hypothetical protein QN277_018554 [Acacia crassicarpa]
MISYHADGGSFKGVKLARSSPVLPHCLFADDTINVMNANKENCEHFRDILHEYEYCSASGQRIDYEKSSLFFSCNTPAHAKADAANCLNINEVSDPGKYLGLPVLWGKLKNGAVID